MGGQRKTRMRPQWIPVYMPLLVIEAEDFAFTVKIQRVCE
jgi:hypothetical protein